MRYPIRLLLLSFVLGMIASPPTFAQDTTDPSKYVSRDEHEKLKHAFEAFKNEVRAKAKVTSPDADQQERFDYFEEELQQIRDLAEASTSGMTNFLLTGYTYAGYRDSEGGNSSFGASFVPIFIWKLNDQIQFTGELEFELEDGETEVHLEFMELDWVINDYVTLRAGKFLTPLSTFKEQLHPAWINKLPDQPLFASGDARLIPTSSLGFQLSGAAPMGSTKLTYALWVSNGPSLNSSGEQTGQLGFSNFSDTNDSKALGGRVGFFPIPELELAYAVLWSEVGDDADGPSFANVDVMIHDVSLGYVRDSDRLGGVLDIRVEYVWSDVDDVVYGDAMVVDNSRRGGYAQIAYRPTKQSGMLKNLEGVFRWDFLDNPSDSSSGVTDETKAYEETRYTIGLNYWLNASSVFKVAYQFDNVDDPQNEKEASDKFMFQFAMGF